MEEAKQPLLGRKSNYLITEHYDEESHLLETGAQSTVRVGAGAANSTEVAIASTNPNTIVLQMPREKAKEPAQGTAVEQVKTALSKYFPNDSKPAITGGRNIKGKYVCTVTVDCNHDGTFTGECNEGGDIDNKSQWQYTSQDGNVKKELIFYNKPHTINGVNYDSYFSIGKGGLFTSIKVFFGKGTLTLPDGTTYKGGWKDGKRHGQGTLTLPDGAIYEGEFVNGQMYGQGTLTLPDGVIYEGKHVNGIRRGNGKYIYPDGRIYEGEFVNDKMYGKGTYKSPDGDIYEGEWRDGKRHGQGTYKLSDGTTYKGEWKDDKMHGNGTCTFPDGTTYKGEWKDGNFTQGTWNNGKCEPRKEVKTLSSSNLANPQSNPINKATDSVTLQKGGLGELDQVDGAGEYQLSTSRLSNQSQDRIQDQRSKQIKEEVKGCQR